jgi:hypothetical protein
MMAIEITESHLRCPFDGKRMMLEVGQDDTTGRGDMRAEHICWHCDYREIDKAWSRPLKTAGTMMADHLRKQRLEGRQLRFVYDDSPFPAEDWGDEEPAGPSVPVVIAELE